MKLFRAGFVRFSPRSVLVFSFILFFVSCAANRGDKNGDVFLGTATVTTKVKTKLLTDKKVDGLDVNVDTYQDTVLLSGFVRSSEEKERAGLLAAQVPGVKAVENNLTVRAE